MEKIPQLKDWVKTPKGVGEIAARSETLRGGVIGVRLDRGNATWQGAAREVELVEAAGEGELREHLHPGRKGETPKKT